MNKLTLVGVMVLALFSCQSEAKKAPESKPAATVDSAAIAKENALIWSMAAFYTGQLPCKDCKGLQTTLTLNADSTRTFALEEVHMGKKPKTTTSSGTWGVSGDVVTLTSSKGSSKYQVTKEGLISFNADGSKRDSTTANKYLLKKVLDE